MSAKTASQRFVTPAKVSAKQNASAKSTASAAAAAKPAPAPTTKPSSPVAVTTTKAPLVTTAAPSAAPAKTSLAKTAPTKAATISTAAPKQSDKRTVGHQYLVLGSYPSLEDAKEAVEKLKKEGVACTAEQSLPDWAKSGWYSVVTVKGYTTTHQVIADVRQFGGRLIVTTTGENHRRIREVIEALNATGWTP